MQTVELQTALLTEERDLLALLDVAAVDFGDADDVAGFAMLVCQTASYAGIFLATGRNKTLISAARKAAKAWLKEVRRNIDRFSAADALTVVSHYESVYRVAYAAEFGAVEGEFVSRYVLRAFEARIRQDHTVNPYTLFRQIARGLDRRERVFFGRPLQWYTERLDRWYRECASGVGAPASADASGVLASAELAQRVAMLLQTNLWAYETGAQDEFKQLLFNRYRVLLDEVFAGGACVAGGDSAFGDGMAFEAVSLETLTALQALLIAGQRYMPREDFEAYRRGITEAIVAHPEANWFRRAALGVQMFGVWQ